MSKGDFEGVVSEMRLASGVLFRSRWFTLTVQNARNLGTDVLRASDNSLLAVMTVEEVLEWGRDEVAAKVFGTTDSRHPLNRGDGGWGFAHIAAGARAEASSPSDFAELRRTPSEGGRCSRSAAARTWSSSRPAIRCTARTRSWCAARRKRSTACMMTIPLGMTKPATSILHAVATYVALTEHYFERERVLLSLLPLAMRMAGPREALWTPSSAATTARITSCRTRSRSPATTRRTPLLRAVRRPGADAKHQSELGMTMVPFRELVYDEATIATRGRRTASRCEGPITVGNACGAMSNSRKAALSRNGARAPKWRRSRKTYLPRQRQGFCVWFTGLSGAGQIDDREHPPQPPPRHGRRSRCWTATWWQAPLEGTRLLERRRDTNICASAFVARRSSATAEP